MTKELHIDSEFITLGQFLKMTDIIQSGGMAKWFLQEHIVYINGEAEDRRGRKLVDGDLIRVPNHGSFLIKSKF